MFNFQEMTVLEDYSPFVLDKKGTISYEYDELTVNEISIEMNLSKYAIEREGYTALDLISDVGGI